MDNDFFEKVVTQLKAVRSQVDRVHAEAEAELETIETRRASPVWSSRNKPACWRGWSRCSSVWTKRYNTVRTGSGQKGSPGRLGGLGVLLYTIPVRLQFEARPDDQPYPQLPFRCPRAVRICRQLRGSAPAGPRGDRHLETPRAGFVAGRGEPARTSSSGGSTRLRVPERALPGGTWNIQLGLRQLPPEGVPVVVEVREGHPEAPQPGGTSPTCPARRAGSRATSTVTRTTPTLGAPWPTWLAWPAPKASIYRRGRAQHDQPPPALAGRRLGGHPHRRSGGDHLPGAFLGARRGRLADFRICNEVRLRRSCRTPGVGAA